MAEQINTPTFRQWMDYLDTGSEACQSWLSIPPFIPSLYQLHTPSLAQRHLSEDLHLEICLQKFTMASVTCVPLLCAFLFMIIFFFTESIYIFLRRRNVMIILITIVNTRLERCIGIIASLDRLLTTTVKHRHWLFFIWKPSKNNRSQWLSRNNRTDCDCNIENHHSLTMVVIRWPWVLLESILISPASV